jgi:hypothetical protein
MVIEPLRPPLRKPLQHRRNQEYHTGDDQFFATALPQAVEPRDCRKFDQQVNQLGHGSYFVIAI